MLTEKQVLVITVLGKLNYLDEDGLKHFGFGKKVIKNLIQKKLICKAKTKYYNIPTLYNLTTKGRKHFKEITGEKVSLSRSVKHDYFHIKNILNYVTLDNIHTYKNERNIRDKYRDRINEYKLLKGLDISCPDCCLEYEGRLIFIETVLDYIKPRFETKKNFILIDKDMELIILRKNNRVAYHYKGGDTLC